MSSLVEKYVDVPEPVVEKKEGEAGDQAEDAEGEDGDESSKDVIDIIEEHDDEEDLLDKLGLSKKVKDPEKMTIKQKEDWEIKQIEDADNREKADEIIRLAKVKLANIKDEFERSVEELSELKEKVIARKADVDKEKLRGPRIEAEFEEKVRQMRQDQIGEIFWIYQESKEEGREEQRSLYCELLNNLMVCLYMEDEDLAPLKLDKPEELQKQIQENWKRQFDDYARKSREISIKHNRWLSNAKNNEKRAARRRGIDTEPTDPQKEFRKIFPRPRPPKGREDAFGEFYEHYEEWIKKLFDDDDEDNGILDESVMDDSAISSVGASENAQSVGDIATKAKAGAGDAIPEEKE